MTLRIDGHYVWDSWIADDGERYHLFFLKAPRTAQGPAARHTAAVVGHATSADLVDWQLEADAFGPAAGAWDDLAIWTGSVVRADDGTWRLFYTAVGTGWHGTRDQRIGAATSSDLTTWTRVGDRPLVEVDTRWYKALPEDATASETWRDPFVFKSPFGHGWHMLIAARMRDEPAGQDGALAHAVSDDLQHGRVLPPATEPAGFSQVEVAQVRQVDGQWVLVFTCHPDEQSPEQVERFGRYCIWSVAGDSVFGPWDLAAARPLDADPMLFAAPLVQRRDGSWALIGFRNVEAEGGDGFEIGDPIPVEIHDGALAAVEPATRVVG